MVTQAAKTKQSLPTTFDEASDRLIGLASRLHNLLEHPEPGLLTWLVAVQDLVDEIAEFRRKQHAVNN